MGKILVPLPDRDFDTTEVSVPWRLLSRAGHAFTFATERGGAAPACDPLLLTGVVFGQLGADPEPRAFYEELTRDPAFRAPQSWSALDVSQFDALLLPGGHAPGMRQYLANEALHAQVARFWALQRPVGAICHGTIVLARAKDASGKSVLHGARTTCLPKFMERAAYFSTFWRRGKYYRTYPEYVEDEVRRNLARPEDFVRGPFELSKRGTETDDSAAFVVEDGRYVSARWPGDAYLFAKKLAERLAATSPARTAVR